MRLENRVKGRNLIGKSNAAAKRIFLEEIKDMQTKSLVLSLMASHCTCVLLPQNNTRQGRA